MNDRTHEQQADDSKQERIIDVVRDIRDQAECYHDAWLNDPVEFCDNEIIVHNLCSIADRIEAACQREAALLIPAKNIEFFDGNGRRQIASGWVKKGGAE